MSTTIHLITSNKLAIKLKNTNLVEKPIIFNEILSEGPVINAFGSDDFWKKRYGFFEQELQLSKLTYFDKIIKELLKANELSTGNEIIIWVENTLVGQLNFIALCTFLLVNFRKDVFYNFVIIKNQNISENELKKAADSKIKLTRNNLLLAKECWECAVEHDFSKYETLNITKYPKFKSLSKLLQDYFKMNQNKIGFYKIVSQILKIIKSGNFTKDEIIDHLIRWDSQISGFGYSKSVYNWYFERMNNYISIQNNLILLSDFGEEELKNETG